METAYAWWEEPRCTCSCGTFWSDSEAAAGGGGRGIKCEGAMYALEEEEEE